MPGVVIPVHGAGFALAIETEDTQVITVAQFRFNPALRTLSHDGRRRARPLSQRESEVLAVLLTELRDSPAQAIAAQTLLAIAPSVPNPVALAQTIRSLRQALAELAAPAAINGAPTQGYWLTLADGGAGTSPAPGSVRTLD